MGGLAERVNNPGAGLQKKKKGKCNKKTWNKINFFAYNIIPTVVKPRMFGATRKNNSICVTIIV